VAAPQWHPNQPIIVAPPDAAHYLSAMDLAIADIAEAIAAGETMAGNVTNHHPVTAAGLVRWIYTVGALRERLAATGRWAGQDVRNRPSVRHVTLGHMLSVIGGTEATGIVDDPRGPLAAHRKGWATAEAVGDAEPLITLEMLLGSPPAPDGGGPPTGHWFLVYHRAEEEIRCEVSLPLGFDRRAGQFTGWKVRVILDAWRPDRIDRRPLDVGGHDVDFRVVEAG
jgi:hypothetical protein